VVASTKRIGFSGTSVVIISSETVLILPVFLSSPAVVLSLIPLIFSLLSLRDLAAADSLPPKCVFLYSSKTFKNSLSFVLSFLVDVPIKSAPL